MHEEEQDGSIPFLDTIITRDQEGCINTKVYRKKTHTDQYLNFQLHHPAGAAVQHKMSIVRPLLERCENIVTTKEDREKELEQIRTALARCGYPKWIIQKVQHNMKNKVDNNRKSVRKKDSNLNRGSVLLPLYVKGLSEDLTSQPSFAHTSPSGAS
jgi:5-methylcytosine-specific restriction endonuclease McrA